MVLVRLGSRDDVVIEPLGTGAGKAELP